MEEHHPKRRAGHLTGKQPRHGIFTMATMAWRLRHGKTWGIPSGYVRHSYGKWPFIVGSLWKMVIYRGLMVKNDDLMMI
jgi:hypothetical protein